MSTSLERAAIRKTEAHMEKRCRGVLAELERAHGIPFDQGMRDLLGETMEKGWPGGMALLHDDPEDQDLYIDNYRDEAEMLIRGVLIGMKGAPQQIRGKNATESKAATRGPYLETRKRRLDLVSFVVHHWARDPRSRIRKDWEAITAEWNKTHTHMSKENLEKTFNRATREPEIMIQLLVTEWMSELPIDKLKERFREIHKAAKVHGPILPLLYEDCILRKLGANPRRGTHIRRTLIARRLMLMFQGSKPYEEWAKDNPPRERLSREADVEAQLREDD